jgi:hypothetical protein
MDLGRPAAAPGDKPRPFPRTTTEIAAEVATGGGRLNMQQIG